MKKLTISIALVGLLMSSISFADDLSNNANIMTIDQIQKLSHEQRKEYIKSLSKDQRKALKKQRREYVKSLSPEQRREMRSKRKEYIQSLPKDQQDKIKERMKNKKEKRSKSAS